MMLATRGNKVGKFKGKPFYLLPKGKCRHGSTGKVQTLADFCSTLKRDELQDLQTLIQNAMAKVVQTTVLGGELK